MAHAQKPDFVFPWNGRVHLNRCGCQFSRLLAAEVCASAWVMLDISRSEVAWEYWLPTPFARFPFTSPLVRHRVPPGSERALPTFWRSFLLPLQGGYLETVIPMYLDHQHRYENLNRHKGSRLIQKLIEGKFFHGTTAPSWPGPLQCRNFMITFRNSILGRTHLDESSAQRRDLYLTKHNTQNRETSMPPVGLEPAIPASERPQTQALDRAAIGIGCNAFSLIIYVI